MAAEPARPCSLNVPDHQALTAYLAAKGIGASQAGAGLRDGTYWVNYRTEQLLGFVIEIMEPAPGSDGRTPGVARAAAPQTGGGK